MKERKQKYEWRSKKGNEKDQGDVEEREKEDDDEP